MRTVTVWLLKFLHVLLNVCDFVLLLLLP